MNTSPKNVESIFNPPPVHMVGDGFRVHNFIPGIPQLSMQRMDPFIMLDYNSRYYFPPTDNPRGVGVHPHRGFETVTIAYHGRIAHHDSHGHSGTIGEGEVQWMTAAGGVLHKEYHEREFSKLGGDFQMVQLWVNLPAANKMDKPSYQAITRDNIRQITLDNVRIELIAGRFREWTGPAKTHSEINMANVMMNAHAELALEYPSTFNTCLLVIEGEITINDTHKAVANQLVLMKNDGESFVLKAQKNSIVLVLSAEPIKEPIAAHGPFVMNSRAELIQAFEDFQDGKFGALED